MYWPQVGRFVSPDTAGPDPANPATFNRYSYVWNNPYKYVDPTGREAVLLTTREKIAGMNVGTHSALIIARDGQSTLYDPAGSYSADHHFGSGDIGDATVADFVKFHTAGGSAVHEIHFDTSAAEEASILAAAEKFGNASAAQCAQATSTALRAAETLKGLDTFTLPGKLQDAAAKIRAKQPGSDKASKTTPAAKGLGSSSSSSSSSSSLSAKGRERDSN